MVEAKLLRKKLKNGLIVDKWDLVTIIEKQQAEIEALKLQLHTTLTNRDLRTYDGKTEINNEPLAYALRKAQEK